jgi:uncharacterized membrane protein
MSEISIQKLDIVGTIKDGISIGMKNIGPILVNILLWLITFWVPYLNIGTTIGLSVGILSKASRGEAISFTEIFDPKYRKYMGEFFLTTGLVSVGAGVGFALMIIPGFVISLAWIFAPILAIDKGKNPLEAISLSNSVTYGNKARMFWILLLSALAFFIVDCILMGIGAVTGSEFLIGLMTFIVFVLAFFQIFVVIGIEASMYKQLAGNV